MSGNRFRVDIPNLLGFLRQGRLKLDDLISDRIAFVRINDGYAALKAGGVLRQLVDFRQV
jgi:S-(hydroxymethyl)glutathione dehydrogenase/alcohol dehydrogenase